MMKKTLNRQDIEALSAFLDGQLPGRERRQLEARLRQEPDLKQAFEELRLTRAVLRRAPQIKRRRNFTLTGEMLGIRSKPRGFAVMRLVSVVASVLFGIMVAGEVFLGGMVMSDAAEVSNSFAAMEEKVSYGDEAGGEAMEATEEAPEEPAPAEAVEEPADMTGEDSGDYGAPADMEEGDAGEEVAAEEAPTDEVAEPSGGGGVPPTATLAAQPTPTFVSTLIPPEVDRLPAATSTPLPTLPEEKGEEPPLAMQASPEETSPQEDRAMDGEEQIVGDTTTGSDDAGGAAPPAKKWGLDVPVIRWMEGGLAILAVISGLIAWLMQRRRK
jgi:hypothetical protein